MVAGIFKNIACYLCDGAGKCGVVVGRTESASLKRFSREHEVGPMVHTIFVLRRRLRAAKSLRGACL